MFLLPSEITEIFTKSRSAEELCHYWTLFSENTGNKVRNHYKQYVDLENEVAQRNSKYLVEFFYEMLDNAK